MPAINCGWFPAYYEGVRLKQSEAMKHNTLLNPPHSPHQARLKSSEIKLDPNHSGRMHHATPDTPVPLIPPTLPLYHVVSSLQYIYGLRISEVLSIRNKDVTPEGFTLIKGKKKSNDRVIYSPFLKELYCSDPKYNDALIFPFSYAQYRLVCIRYGICILPSGKRIRRIISHTYRHHRINGIYKLTQHDLIKTKQFTGQKTNIAALHYITST